LTNLLQLVGVEWRVRSPEPLIWIPGRNSR
jgi:hypothetical protein